MKRISRTITYLFCIAALFSCAKEIEQEVETPGDGIIPEGYTLQTFTALSEDTKTSLNGGNTVWSEGDQIRIIYSDGSASDPFTLTGGVNTTTGEFQGLVPNGKTASYAVYPASAYSSVDGSTVKVSIPSFQAGSFAAGNIAVAKVAANHNMSFKNVNAFLVFQLKSGTDVTRVDVTSVGGGNLAATVPVSCAGDIPTPGNAVSGATSSTISMTTSGAGIYYMSIIPGITHTKGLKMTYYAGDTETGVYYLNRELPIVANQMYTLGEVETGRNYYVTVSGAGSLNGMDWANAFSAEQMWKKVTLTAAQESDSQTKQAKLASIDGATFHLGAGTYNFGATPLLSFEETNPITLTFKGGYPSSGGTQDLTAAGNRACFSGADAHAALILRDKINVTFEGVNFVNGLAGDDEEEIESSGAAPKVAAALDAVGSGVSITMRYCNVSDNDHSANGNWGAGVRLNGVGSFTADHVTFADNSAPAAPALSVRDTDIEVTDCTFSGNEAKTSNAGAVYLSGSSTAEFASCTFSGNASLAKDGGAVHQNGTVSSTFTDCTFTGNSAFNDDCDRSSGNGYGGAINITADSSTEIEDCTFSGNMAWRGGCVHVQTTGTATFTGCTFSANGSSSTTRGGGVGYIETSAIFSDCTFGGANSSDGNKAKYGGALHHVSSGVLDIEGGTFQNNVANNCGGAICDERGLRVRLYDSILKTYFLNNKVTSDSADDGGGAIWAETGSTSSERNVSVRNAVFKGNEAYSGGAVYNYKDKTGTYFYDCIFGGSEEGDGNYSRGGSGEGGGGTLYMVNKTYCTLKNCTITGDHARRYGGSVYAKTTGNLIVEGCIFNGCYSTSGWGGAILTRKVAMDQLTIKGGAFINCYSNCGGAILVAHTGKFAVTDWNDAGTLFEGNYADHATNIYQGGAIQIEGNSSVSDGASTLRVTIWKAKFIGNYAGQGGAIYSKDSGKPDIYIDRCSFDGNYITKRWGPVIATDGCYRFHMNNCTIRNSYTTSTSSEEQSALRPSWVCIDGLPADGVASISNCSIIGNVQYSANGSSFTPLTGSAGALVVFWGSQPNYLINNIIVPNSASVTAVCGTGSETVDMYYNQLGTVSNLVQTDSGGNVTGLTASSFDGLSWTSGLWQWSGTIGGSAPSKITGNNFISRLTSINSAYVDWIATPDIRYDYRGVDRGDGGAQWWPGAYQVGAGAEVLLKVITWNIRSSEMDDSGDRAWSARRSGVAALINDKQPQILCMQECESDQRSYLVNNCPNYAAIYDNTSLSWWQNIQGVERSAEVILYNTEEISVLSSGTFWLVSGAPTSPSKSSSQNSYRSCTWMKCMYHGQKMLVLDVHLSYRTKNNSTLNSDEVIALRQSEMNVIKTWIDGHYNAANDGWLLFMGDMNTTHWEAIFDEWKDGTYGYFSRDACPSAATGRTFNNWDWESEGTMTIDFQFYKGFPSVKSYKIPTDTYDSGVAYLSDHWPVVVEYGMN